MPDDFTTPIEVRDVYRRRARHYDVTANLFYGLGFRELHYRRLAVEALCLRRGDTVVEIGCGTGLNFALLEDKVGSDGQIIGVDLTDAMLDRARERTARNGWSNVALVESRAADYRIPDDVDAILTTFALTLEPHYEQVIAQGARALRPGGRFALLDIRLPSNWLRRFAPLLIALLRPFAVSMTVAQRKPWEAMERHFPSMTMQTFYCDIAYLAVGTAKGGEG